MASSDSKDDPPKSPCQGLTMSEAFTLRINSIVKSGFISLGLALGSKLGLFQKMCEIDKPASSQEIADAADCKERYVREWLYMMTASEIVEMSESGEELFFLPPVHRAGVTSPQDGSLVDMAWRTPLLGHTFVPLLDCFKKDGPLGITTGEEQVFLNYWESERRLTGVMTGVMDQMVEQVPGMKEQLESGIQCMDIGGGRGYMAILLAQRFPKSEFFSCDISKEATEKGMAEAQKLGLTNVSMHVEDCHNLPQGWTGKFDYLLMIQTLHDLPFPTKATEQAFRVLKPGGYMSIVDVQVNSDSRITAREELNYDVYVYSLFHCLSPSLAVEGSKALGTAAGVQKLTSVLKEGGFKEVHQLKLTSRCHLLCHKS